MLPLLLALPALAAAGALAGLALADLRSRARARRVRAALGEPARELDPHAAGETTVEGLLAFEHEEIREIVTVFPTGTEGSEVPVLGARSNVASGARVALGRKQVRLEGPIQVLVGSREGSTGARVVRVGDRVRARGRLYVVASDTSEGGYREGSAAFCLAPPKDDEWKAPPIPLAFAGAPRVRRPVPAVLGGLAGLLAAVVLTMFSLAPARPARKLRPERPACAAAIGSLLDGSRLWEAEARLAGCPDPLIRARTRWMLGDFEGARSAYQEARTADPDLEPTVTEAEAHALAGDAAGAAEVVGVMARTWYRGPDTVERRRLVCIADAFAARADPAAQARLQATYDAHSAWPARPELDCALLLADLKSGKDERGQDARVWALQTDDDKRGLRRLLILEGGFVNDYVTSAFLFDDRYPLPAMTNPQSWLRGRALAVEKALAERLPGTGVGAESAAEVALFHAFMGDAERAGTMLQSIPDHGHGRSTYVVAAIAAAHAGDYAAAARFLRLGASDSNAVASIEQSIRMLRGEPLLPYPDIMSDEVWSPNRELFAAGYGGDGEALAAALDDLHTDGRVTLLRLFPRITRGRDALSRWLDERYPAPCTTCGLSALAMSTGTRFVLARALGDRPLEEKLAPLARKLEDAVLDRKWALPFLLLETFVR